MVYYVKPVITKNEFANFIRLPFLLYGKDANWAAPIISEVKRTLNVKKNPFFNDCTLKLFNCYKDYNICARAAVIINNRYQQLYKTKTAFFGFFDSIWDFEASRRLFSEMENYCRDSGIEELEGPFNPNHYSELGIQTSAFNTPQAFFQTYNPPYYCKLLEQNGFSVSERLQTRANHNISKCIKAEYEDNLPEEESGYKIRNFNMKNMREELECLREIFNDAFQLNHYFLPLSKEEYLFAAKYMKMVTEQELIKFVELNRKPVGALHLVYDVNPLIKEFNGKFNIIKYLKYQRRKKNIGNLIIYAVGVKRKYRYSPAYKLLLNSMVNLSKNYRSLETTWIAEDNSLALNAAGKLLLQADKEFVIMKKKIKGSEEIN